MRAKKIKMKPHTRLCVQNIDSIYIDDHIQARFRKVEELYDLIVEHPKLIIVDHGSHPFLVPAISEDGKKYVRSQPEDTIFDELLKLPRV